MLLWGNCARCTTAPSPDPQSGSHDCCHKPQNGKPLKQNCDLNAADLTKAAGPDQHSSDVPLAEVGAVMAVAVAPVVAPAVVDVEPLASPPERCLLYSVFRI